MFCYQTEMKMKLVTGEFLEQEQRRREHDFEVLSIF